MEIERPTSRVVSVAEEGILFDTFGKEEKFVAYTQCQIYQDVVVYSTDTQVLVVDASTMKTAVLEVAGVKKIELSPDGMYLGLHTRSQELVIATQKQVVHTVEKVHQFEMARRYVAYTQEVSEEAAAGLAPGRAPSKAAAPAPIYAGEGEEAAGAKKKKPLQWGGKAPQGAKPAGRDSDSAAGTKRAQPRLLKVLSLEKLQETDLKTLAPFIFTVTENHVVLARMYHEAGGEVEVLHAASGKRAKHLALPTLMAAAFIRDRKHRTDHVLCLCTLNEHSGTYYDKKMLYYLNMDKGVYKVVGVDNPICDVEFLKKETFAVCYGNSPSQIAVFNSSLEKVHDLKTGVRNKMFFNRQENIACFAGMNNLPGNIEIFEHPSNIFVSENEVVGCSVIDWSPCGTFYLVGVTNRMKIDNKVAVFDYYSRKVAEKSFKSLVDCRFLGKTKPFKGVEHPPEKIKVEAKVAYVPPSLRTSDSAPACSWVPPHIITNKDKAKERKIKQLQAELAEVLAIEQRINQGEMVPGGILKIQKKDALQKKLAQKTKQLPK